MDKKLTFYIVILVVIIVLVPIIYWISVNGTENFGDLLSLSPYKRCEMLGVKKFMVRDLRTKLWLFYHKEAGFSKFSPGGFGIPLVLSSDPSEYLPLRMVADPTMYFVVTDDGKRIKTVSNPDTDNRVIQIFIYNGYNVMGYLTDEKKTKYIFIDDNGYADSIDEPYKASVIEIIEI